MENPVAEREARQRGEFIGHAGDSNKLRSPAKQVTTAGARLV